MKKFIVKMVIFLSGFLLLVFLIQNIVILGIRKIDVGEYGVLNRIVEGKINSEILICGSSRAQVHFDTTVISRITGMSCYNIGLTGSSFGIELPVLKTYLRHNVPPRVLVQEVGISMLSMDKKIYLPYKYIPYLNQEDIYSGLLKIKKELWIHKYFPMSNLFYFNTDFQKIVLKDLFYIFKKEDYLRNGFLPKKKKWEVDISRFKKDNPNGLVFKVEKRAISYLNELIRVCRKNRIKLVFVSTPEYFEVLPFQKNREEVKKCYREISGKNQIPYLDYSEMSISKDKRFFYNFEHMNASGAANFSRRFSLDLKKII